VPVGRVASTLWPAMDCSDSQQSVVFLHQNETRIAADGVENVVTPSFVSPVVLSACVVPTERRSTTFPNSARPLHIISC
jgi:hypothetical protein